METTLSFFVDRIPLTIVITSALQVYKINLQDQTIDILPFPKRDFFSYYGVSWSEDFLFLVESENNRLRSCIKVYDKHFTCVETLRPDIYDTHQIQYYDNRLYICDTSKDMCKVYNMLSGTYEEPFYVSEYREDTLHLNSVYIYNDLVYLLCHGKENGASIKIYNKDTRELVDSWAQGLEDHNIVRYKNDFLVCSSEERKLLLKNGRVLYTTSWNTYLRGIALTEKHMCIGESRYSGVDRSARMKGKCFFSIFDVKSDTKIGSVVLDSGVIYELRAISEPDAAHCFISNTFWD